jgi:AraC-like DNA-binding protein
MTTIKTYSTDGAGSRSKINYWNDLHARVFYPLEVAPRDPRSFEAAFSVADLGTLAVVRTVSSAATIERSDRHISEKSARHVALIMPVQNPLRSRHYGNEVDLDEGDFVLTESLTPSRTSFDRTNTSLVIVLPYDILLRYLPDPEAVFGRRVCGNRSFGQLAGTMLRAIWAQAEQGLPPECGPSLARGLLEVIATACAMEHRAAITASSVAVARRAQIKRFVERHLRESDLTATSVAKGLGLSPRYARMIFAAEGEGIAEYIMRRRLEECASQLANALWRNRSITDTAFAWGFSSMAHFTRVFKEHFAVTPSEYRRIQTV